MADQGAEGLLSPYLRRQRFAAARPFLRGRVLDVGCGAGGLSQWAEPDTYLGVEVDAFSRGRAQVANPRHRFVASLAEVDGKFDTVVALAVIEHVNDPAAFLTSLASHLQLSAEARVVVTTPHPSIDWVHDAGAAVGLFSRHANEEHEDLLDENKLRATGAAVGLTMQSYKRFLFGANQIASFAKG
jgi:SAM-dependent methyltransferase